MFKKNKSEWHAGERYPGGRASSLPGAASHSKQKRATAAFKRILSGLQTTGCLRSTIEKLFVITLFALVEMMIAWVLFHMLDNIFNRSLEQTDIRTLIKFIQLLLFIVFTYANIMASFFRVNIFQ